MERNAQLAATKANSILTLIISWEFIVALHTLVDFFSNTITLSRLLQKQGLCVEIAAKESNF